MVLTYSSFYVITISMFLKIVKSANKTDYIYVVESYRDDKGNINHNYLFSLGRLKDFISTPMFKKLSKKALASDSGFNLQGIELSHLSEGEVLKYGHFAIKRLWDKFNLDEFFHDRLCKANRRKIDIAEAVFYMVCRHMMEPDSKLGMYESQIKYLRLPELNLNHFYRALDALADAKQKIEDYIFEQNQTLFNMSIDVVFYDVTTFYFESKDEDLLRRFGFSKDGKAGDVQVVLGLLVDKEGRPVGYDIFAGNTFDGKTLEPFLMRLKNRFSIQKIIIVADRGINSKVNLLRLKELGYGYIVACRLKGMGKKIKEQVFTDVGYKSIEMQDEVFRYKIIEHQNRFKENKNVFHSLDENIIVSYSSKRARKDAHDRERLIKKAEELMEAPSKIKALNKKGGRKYLTGQGDDTSKIKWQIDSELIEQDRMYDGYYAIQTSEKNLQPSEVIEAYHNLWKIEESFRIMKTTLEVRPIFHWTEKRIRGHFVLCFLSFLMMRTLEILLTEQGLSVNNIREALNSLTVTKFSIKDETVYLKNKPDVIANIIMRKLRIKPIANIISDKEFVI